MKPHSPLLRMSFVIVLVFVAPIVFFSQAHAQDGLPPWAPAEPLTMVLPAVEAESASQPDEVATLWATARSLPWVKHAFISHRYGNADIFTANSDGSGQTRLTFTNGAESRPAISPDGKWIAYDMNLGGDSGRELLMIPAAGGDPILLVDPNGDSTNISPAWSPDGTKIAFTSTRDGNAEIYLYHLSTAIQERVTWDPFPDFDPSWNPVSGELIWARQVNELEGIIVARGANGAERALSGPIRMLETPIFDATGTYLSYTADLNWDGLGDVVLGSENGVHALAHSRLEANEYVEYRLGARTISFFLSDSPPDFPELFETIKEDVTVYTEFRAKRYSGNWYLVDMQARSVWTETDFGAGPNGYVTRASIDHTVPTAILTPALAVGRRDKVVPGITVHDPGPAGVMVVEYVYEEINNSRERLLRPPVNKLPDDWKEGCGTITWKVRALDGAGHVSPWVSHSATAYQRSFGVRLRDPFGAAVAGVTIGNSLGNQITSNITDVNGSATVYSCYDPNIGDWGPESESNWHPVFYQVPLNPNLTVIQTIGAVFTDGFNYDDSYSFLNRWEVEGEPKSCTNEANYYYHYFGCLLLVGSQPSATQAETSRVVTASSTRETKNISPDLPYYLLLSYRTQNVEAQTPLTVTLASSAWPTPTVTLVEKLPKETNRLVARMTDLPIGDVITVTIQSEVRSNAPNAMIIIDRIDVLPRLVPIVKSVSSVAPALVGETTDTLAASSVYTITGENFVEPVSVLIGDTMANNVQWIDSGTLVASFTKVLPPGMHTLWVENRTDTPDATRGGKASAVPIGKHLHLPAVRSGNK